MKEQENTDERSDMSLKKKILTVSSANMDFVMNVRRVPNGGETVQDPGSYAFIPGGKGANAAVAIRRLGGDSVFCTRLGNDANGNMLTGWQWIKGSDGVTRCYYLNPNKDNTLGACLIGPAVTPDGFTVDANGAWTVNGVVQTK